MTILLSSVWDDLEDWLDGHGPDVLTAVIVITAAYLVFRVVFPRLARAAISRGRLLDEEMVKRTNTIIGVIERSAGVAFAVIGVVTVLPDFGVDITAIVTGLGITGLALALGAQTLVRDAINGIFLLAEDAYREGDVIKVADVTGTVEGITLRRTIIRDSDGVVHSVPNGSIGVVSNYTREFAVVNVEVRVSYGEDLERVRRVIETVGREMASAPDYREQITEPPALGAVESVGDAGVTIGVRARTRPEARWQVAAELRRRLAEAFLREGIRVPFPTLGPEHPDASTREQT